MTTTQHSSGPWIVKGGNVIENESGVNIAKAWMTDREEECANANLIASAPDLLSALRNLADYVFRLESKENICSSVWMEAREAIAKAEGKQ